MVTTRRSCKVKHQPVSVQFQRHGDFFKLTNKLERHRNVQYKCGYIRDIIAFNPQGTCQPGGIYFCAKSRISEWLFYNLEIGIMRYMRPVFLIPESQVYEEGTKLKSDQLILGRRQKIPDSYYFEFLSQNERRNTELNCVSVWLQEDWSRNILLKWLTQDGSRLRYIPAKCQTEDLVLPVVSKHGESLGWVHEAGRTYNCCLAAVQQSGFAIQYVPDHHHTEVMCLTAVKKHPWSIRHVKFQTQEMANIAVQYNGLILQHICPSYKTLELCDTAIEMFGDAVQWVPNPTYSQCLKAVQHKEWSYAAMYFIPKVHRTEELMIKAVSTNARSLLHIDKSQQTKSIVEIALKKSDECSFPWYVCHYKFFCHLHDDLKNDQEIQWLALKKCHHTIRDIPNPTVKMYEYVLEQKPENLVWFFEYGIKNLPEELYIMVVQKDGILLQYVHVTDQTPLVCETAVRQNPLALQYVSNQTRELCKLAITQNADASRYCKLHMTRNGAIYY